MFREISHLANNELDEIFSNLLEVEVKNLEPEQMPPVVYQILLLTTEHPSFIGKLIIEKLRGGRFLWKISEIWAGFGPVGKTEKKIGPIVSNFWGWFFFMFSGAKKFLDF